MCQPTYSGKTKKKIKTFFSVLQTTLNSDNFVRDKYGLSENLLYLINNNIINNEDLSNLSNGKLKKVIREYC